jgi:uncharacterized membrane protein
MKKRFLSPLTIAELIIAVVPVIFYLVIFRSMPEKIAVHFSGSFVADKWAPKFSAEAVLDCALGFIGLLIGKGLTRFVAIFSDHDKESAQLSRRIMVVTEIFLTALFSALAITFL